MLPVCNVAGLELKADML